MFTGIVEAVGEVTAVDADGDGRRLRIAADLAGDLDHGESVAVSGTCLTVEAADADAFTVFLAAETVDRTSLGDRRVGDRVNVERAMPADGRFDGHIVQGHVDTTTRVRRIERVGEDWAFEFALPAAVAPYVVEKGSIALDGISLTVASLDADSFTVAIIPTTYADTTLSDRDAGDEVNVEVDVIAKYVERLLADRGPR